MTIAAHSYLGILAYLDSLHGNNHIRHPAENVVLIDGGHTLLWRSLLSSGQRQLLRSLKRIPNFAVLGICMTGEATHFHVVGIYVVFAFSPIIQP